MKRNHIIWLIVVLGALAISSPPAYGQSAKSSLKDPEQALMFNRISDRLVCQCGCSMILRTCNHYQCPSATPMRARIEKEILAGTGEEEIIQGFVDEYGIVILATPPAEGFNLVAWVLPGFAILIGLFILAYITMSWVSKRKHETAAAGPPPGLDTSISARIENELKQME
jgi:cytochrome c-type biogenesis protein CcmH